MTIDPDRSNDPLWRFVAAQAAPAPHPPTLPPDLRADAAARLAGADVDRARRLGELALRSLLVAMSLGLVGWTAALLLR
jgi:hypothetical protein